MLLDFSRVRNKEITFSELVDGLTVKDLRDLTNEMVDNQLALIKDCTDADVIFEPIDEDAHDPDAATEEEIGIAWTLGHVIVHTTSSAEEAAFLAAEMARGVEFEPRRSRSEIHWTTVKTIAACRKRLEESRRMRLASLELWPDQPYLENTYKSPRSGVEINPVMRFVFGLSHDDSHLGHIAEIVRQTQQK